MQFIKGIICSKNLVNVVVINLDTLEMYLSDFMTYLSDEEKIQASKFSFDHLKKHYILSHGLLRALLGIYLSVPPSKVGYTYNEFGKPLPMDTQTHKGKMVMAS